MFRSEEEISRRSFCWWHLKNLNNFYVRYIRNGFRTLPTSKVDFFVMTVNDMQYFYINECVFVVQGLKYQVKSMYA